MSDAFDSEAARKMAGALSLAMDRLKPDLQGNPDEVRSILARAIIDLAETGERDEEKLAVYAIEQHKKISGERSGGNSIN